MANTQGKESEDSDNLPLSQTCVGKRKRESPSCQQTPPSRAAVASEPECAPEPRASSARKAPVPAAAHAAQKAPAHADQAAATQADLFARLELRFEQAAKENPEDFENMKVMMNEVVQREALDILDLSKFDAEKADLTMAMMYNQKIKMHRHDGFNCQEEEDATKRGRALANEIDTMKSVFDKLQGNDFNFTLDPSQDGIMASRWARAKKGNPKLKEDYKQCVTHQAKAEFRRKFAQGEYSEYIAERQKKEKMTEVTEADGEYLSIQRIAHKEGNGPAGMKAATSYCIRALQLGGRWCHFDTWTDRVKFLYITHKYREKLEKAWSTYETWHFEQVKDPKPEKAGALAAGARQVRSTSLGFFPDGLFASRASGEKRGIWQLQGLGSRDRARKPGRCWQRESLSVIAAR